MKRDELSINKIYGNIDIQTLTNRIKFLENHSSKCHIDIKKMSRTDKFHCETKYAKDNSEKKHIRKTLQTESSQCIKEAQTTRNQKLMELKYLKTQKYKQCKLHSQKIFLAIKSQRENDYLSKRLKKIKIQKEEQKCRKKLQQFQQKRIHITMQKNKYSMGKNIAIKNQIQKKQLMEEEQKFINYYEQSLIYKSQLMRKIKNDIKTIQEN